MEKLTTALTSAAAANPVFASLPKPDLQAVLSAGSWRKFPKGSLIAHLGEVWPYLFLTLDGTVCAYKESREGRSLLVATFEPPDLFWGLAFYYDQMGMPVSLEAHTGCQMMLWDRLTLLPYLLKNGAASWELSRLMVARMLQASDLVEGLAFHPVACRVARFLLEQIQPEQAPKPRDLTLDEMAARIGTTREMVCRYLRSFSDEGLIHITRTEYHITDRQGLSQLAGQA